jgi:ubiquinone/menaquinone biosynthesis C-methylase UbiE
MKYTENALDLENRIRAHKLFSRATLESVLKQTLDDLDEDPMLLDLGCGSGNYFELFKRKTAHYVGIDVSKDLLTEFAKKFTDKKILIRASMDELPEFPEGIFDAIYSIYSIYYTEKPRDLIASLHGMLAKNGQFVVLGPGRSAHAPEISRFIESVPRSGLQDRAGPAKNKNTRIEKFHCELTPLITDRFVSARTSEIDTSLVFPDSAEWAKYVASTPEVRESLPAMETGDLTEAARRFSETSDCRVISKTMLCLLARR